MRLLGVDFGFRRIGLAVGESQAAIATPRNSLTASGMLKRDAESIAAVARQEEADAVIVGLPIEPTGEEGDMARICRLLAGHLETLGCVVNLEDERLSSVEAEETLVAGGLKASRRRKLRDGEAACIILERFMSHEEASP